MFVMLVPLGKSLGLRIKIIQSVYCCHHKILQFSFDHIVCLELSSCVHIYFSILSQPTSPTCLKDFGLIYISLGTLETSLFKLQIETEIIDQ